MKYIVTGGAGFIGSHITDRLINDGHTVIVIDNESSDSNERFYWNAKSDNHKLDILDYENIRPLFEGVDAVFHLAAEARIQPAIHNPLHAAKVNFVGTCTVLQCAREAQVERVIYSSTSSGYGLKNTPPLREDMPRDCLNPYSVTKCGGEELCKMYYDLYGVKTITLRYFNVYGERQPLRGEYAPVIGLFLRQFRSGEPMTIVGDGTQQRDFTYIKDVIAANIAAAETTNTKAFGQIFNVGTGKNYSINELVSLIGGPSVNLPHRLGEAQASLADTSKSREVLQWTASYGLENWLEKELSTHEN
jgi:UDP-glucose 4-epimerase